MYVRMAPAAELLSAHCGRLPARSVSLSHTSKAPAFHHHHRQQPPCSQTGSCGLRGTQTKDTPPAGGTPASASSFLNLKVTATPSVAANQRLVPMQSSPPPSPPNDNDVDDYLHGDGSGGNVGVVGGVVGGTVGVASIAIGLAAYHRYRSSRNGPVVRT